jgi:hypothetical protein
MISRCKIANIAALNIKHSCGIILVIVINILFDLVALCSTASFLSPTLYVEVPMSMPIGTSRNYGCDLSSDATNMVKFSDATKMASVDARDDLLHEELDVRIAGNNNDILWHLLI